MNESAVIRALEARILSLYRLMQSYRRKVKRNDFIYGGDRGKRAAQGCRDELLTLLQIRRTGR